MDQFIIRKACEEDIPIIDTFNRSMALETEDHQLPEDVSLSGVTRLFERSKFGFYVVAELEGEVVASLLVTYEWSDWRDGLIWWIQSVYVHPEHRRKGIFRKLYAFVREGAEKSEDVRGIRLYVHDENVRAQETYKQLGMQKTAYLVFEEMLR